MCSSEAQRDEMESRADRWLKKAACAPCRLTSLQFLSSQSFLKTNTNRDEEMEVNILTMLFRLNVDNAYHLLLVY